MAILFIFLGLFALYPVSNLIVVLTARGFVTEPEKAKAEDFPADAILVLGAGVRPDGTPSNMLEDRLLTALALYRDGVADALIVSGDHGSETYDEVNTMKDYLIDKGVPSERIFMDHAGFSTYDSLYRAKAVFGAKSLFIVTQRYHAYRAVFDGRMLGMDCRAVAAPILSSSVSSYPKQPWYSFRESIARAKDFVFCLFKPAPEYLGEPVSLAGSGDVTNDR